MLVFGSAIPIDRREQSREEQRTLGPVGVKCSTKQLLAKPHPYNENTNKNKDSSYPGRSGSARECDSLRRFIYEQLRSNPTYGLDVRRQCGPNSVPHESTAELRRLDDNNINEETSITMPDFDNGQAIESFTATFQLKLGPGTSPPADGVAFSFGPDIYRRRDIL